MISQVQIRNFKSIKEVDFSCKRINLFIGKPNVGKSNILEALSLFGLGYYYNLDILRSVIRMNYVQELFYRKDIKKPVFINTNIGAINIGFNTMDIYYFLIDPEKKRARENIHTTYSTLKEEEDFFYSQYANQKTDLFNQSPVFYSQNNNINNFTLNTPFRNFYSPIKRYSFRQFPHTPTTLYYGHSLVVPFGDNIVTVLYSERELLEFFAEIFKSEYGLDLVIKSPENILEVQIREGIVANAIPINLVADTLQRLMFYLTAIKSNTNSILLFEEPETHSFPTYTNMLADNISRSKDNQFFITTHSPYLISTLLDSTPKDDIAIFIATYKDHQTKIHELADHQISELLDYNVDLFYNFIKFVD
ncbi:MAG TPA: AAA family ATPase [Chitinophagales bacterium]|nr:AAA family ATPase [Chitinophagales bacterium]